MKILWIINGLTLQQMKKRKISSFTMASWIEALIENISFSKNKYDILFPVFEGEHVEFIENDVRFISFNIGDKFGLIKGNELALDQYDVIHIWGLEYSYVHRFIELFGKEEVLNKTILSIQGICNFVGEHYCDGISNYIIHRKTIRDLIKKDSIICQKRMFLKKGRVEKETLKKLKYVSGRTTFDKQYINSISPQIEYYYCSEGLRKEFYKFKWEYAKCEKNRIFISQGYYSIKGLHIALEALQNLKQLIPDVKLVVAGLKPYSSNKFKDSSYARYIRDKIKSLGLENCVIFLGQLSQEEMIQEYLKCNVFIMPSLIENSPNSVCEAMLLGVPVVASYVGGIPDLIKHASNGYLFQWNAPYMLTEYIKNLLLNEKLCKDISNCERKTAYARHDIMQIMRRWDEIYENIVR